MSPLLVPRSSSSEQLWSPGSRRGHGHAGGSWDGQRAPTDSFLREAEERLRCLELENRPAAWSSPLLSPSSSLFSQLLRCRFSSSLLRNRNPAERKPGAGVSVLATPTGKAQPIAAWQHRSTFVYVPITHDPPARSNTRAHTQARTRRKLLYREPAGAGNAAAAASGAHSICRGCSCAKALLFAPRLASFMFPSPFSPRGSTRFCTFPTAR